MDILGQALLADLILEIAMIGATIFAAGFGCGALAHHFFWGRHTGPP